MTSPIFALLFLLSAPTTSLERGDQEFARIRYPIAEAMYDSALSSSADSADVLWRLARVYVCKADVAQPDQKLRIYRQAEAFAARCIRADSTKASGHTWRAAALGNIAMFEGSKAKVKLCNVIKNELDCSISLNPNDDIAHSILGSFYMALGDISWIERQLAAVFLGSLPDGGYVEAEVSLKRAIALSPNVIRHHFELGELLMLLDRNQEACNEFRLVATLQILLASDERTKQSAASRLANFTAE